MNIDNFSDADLLNIVNNAILKKTDYELSEFTGGSISATTAYKHKVLKYKVTLFFGYKSDKKSSRSYSFDITDNVYFLWSKALMLKAKSMQISVLGDDFNELIDLMKPVTKKEEKKEKNESEKNVRTDTRSVSEHNLTPNSNSLTPNSITSNSITPNSITPVVNAQPTIGDLKHIKSMKEFYKKHRLNEFGDVILFKYNNLDIYIDELGIPRHYKCHTKFDYNGSDNFYKTVIEMHKNLQGL